MVIFRKAVLLIITGRTTAGRIKDIELLELNNYPSSKEIRISYYRTRNTK